jgi:hypothetical protein
MQQPEVRFEHRTDCHKGPTTLSGSVDLDNRCRIALSTVGEAVVTNCSRRSFGITSDCQILIESMSSYADIFCGIQLCSASFCKDYPG